MSLVVVVLLTVKAPENVKAPVAVSVASDLKKLLPWIPSTVSASKPVPVPSFPECQTVEVVPSCTNFKPLVPLPI